MRCSSAKLVPLNSLRVLRVAEPGSLYKVVPIVADISVVFFTIYFC